MRSLTQRLTIKWQDHPLQVWVPFIDSYIDEMLRLEGRGDLSDLSACTCGLHFDWMSIPGYRCDDCHDMRLFCVSCFVFKYLSNPLHRAKVSSLTIIRFSLALEINDQCLERIPDIEPTLIPVVVEIACPESPLSRNSRTRLYWAGVSDCIRVWESIWCGG